jgi:hypothetical protein
VSGLKRQCALGLVSGHDFSPAVNGRKKSGFSP